MAVPSRGGASSRRVSRQISRCVRTQLSRDPASGAIIRTRSEVYDSGLSMVDLLALVRTKITCPAGRSRCVGGSETPFWPSERFLNPPRTLSSLILSALRYSRRSWVTPGGSQETLIIAHHHCHACPRSMTIGTMGHQPHGCWSPPSVRWLSPLLGGIHPLGGCVGGWWLGG